MGMEEVEAFIYLVSIMAKQGGTGVYVRTRIGKARIAFLQRKNIWSAKMLSAHTMIRLFNPNINPVLLYGVGTCRTPKPTTKKVLTSVNSCLRRIPRI